MPAARKEPPKQTFEQSLRRLEAIVEQLERGDVTLDQSLQMYEEGIALAKTCADKLTQAELKLKKLGKDMEGHLHLTEEESE
jgi:exodeoxyribonuclease VII small subunit